MRASSDVSKRGQVDARFAQARELVAQRARADSEPCRDFTAARATRAQRIENQVTLGLPEAVGERAASRRRRDRWRLDGRFGRELELNVLGENYRAIDENERALQQVVELAHV